MFRGILVLLVCMLSGIAHADTTVVIKGKKYAKGLIKSHKVGATYVHINALALPDSYDAVLAGKATGIKGSGQGSCGDCWAWARTSSMESAAILAGTPFALSEEDTTDNARDEYGCGGGEMDFNYEISHGQTSLAICPWMGGGRSCNSKPVAQGLKMAYIGSPGTGPSDDEMKAAIFQYGSVAVTVAAEGDFDVDSGTDRMTSCGSSGIDHMVSFVGWRPAPSGGVEFKMKNSWGTSWGASGFAYMKIGCNEIATGDQSAMVVSLPGTPVVMDLGLPIEVLAAKGTEIAIQIKPVDGLTYLWSTGDKGPLLWITPTASTTVSLVATDAKGTQTTGSVKLDLN